MQIYNYIDKILELRNSRSRYINKFEQNFRY